MSENQSRPHGRRWFAVRAAVVVLALALTIGSYFLARPTKDDRSAGPAEQVTVAYSATPDSALVEIAQKQGYHLQEGLQVTLHAQPYGKLALQDVLEGKADFATVAETPVVLAIMAGEEISLFATIQISSRNNAIIARQDMGILTPDDLRGRKIGTTAGTTADFFLEAFLVTHGIARGQVETVPMEPEQLGDALANGALDAISVFPPFLTQTANKLGDRGIIFYEEEMYTQTFNVVAKQEFIRSRPEVAKKMLRALVRAEEFARENPAAAQVIVADLSRMDPAVVRKIWSDSIFEVTLDQSLLLAMEDESRWAIKNGLTARWTIPNYLDYIYLGGLQSVRPGAVTILR